MILIGLFLITAWAAEPTGCALALGEPIKFPFVVAPFGAPALTSELERDLAKIGSPHEAFALIEGRVKPVMQNVAWFLQTRGNYPAAFESNELAAQADAVHDELQLRLQTLKGQRRPPEPRSRWSNLFAPVVIAPEPDAVVTEIRVLHYTLNALDADLAKRGEAARNLARVTEELLGIAHETHAALGALLTTLERSTPGDLPPRVSRLHEDLGLQIHLVQAIDANLYQRNKVEELTRERIRRLVRVILPMEVVMAGAALDLSPLAPADARPAEERRSAPKLDGPRRELSMPVGTLIELAKRASFPSECNETIQRYFNASCEMLTPADIKLLVEALRDYNPKTYRAEIISKFGAARAATLTLDDVVFLARQSSDSERHDMFISEFAKSQIKRLTNENLIRLAQEIKNTSYRRDHLALMGIK